MTEEKMKAIKVLEQAVNAVLAATDAIDKLAEEYDLSPKVKPGETVTFEKLADAVSSITEQDEGIVLAILRATFHLIRDMDLTIVEEKEADDE